MLTAHGPMSKTVRKQLRGLGFVQSAIELTESDEPLTTMIRTVDPWPGMKRHLEEYFPHVTFTFKEKSQGEN